MPVNELPAVPGLLIDLCFPAVGLNWGAIATLLRDEVPIELDPRRLAVDVDGHVARGQLPL